MKCKDHILQQLLHSQYKHQNLLYTTSIFTHEAEAWLSDEDWFLVVAEIMFVNWKTGINLYGLL
jgi:hypothetical protein